MRFKEIHKRACLTTTLLLLTACGRDAVKPEKPPTFKPPTSSCQVNGRIAFSAVAQRTFSTITENKLVYSHEERTRIKTIYGSFYEVEGFPTGIGNRTILTLLPSLTIDLSEKNQIQIGNRRYPLVYERKLWNENAVYRIEGDIPLAYETADLLLNLPDQHIKPCSLESSYFTIEYHPKRKFLVYSVNFVLNVAIQNPDEEISRIRDPR